MRFAAGVSRPSVASARAALVSLVALTAVIVALVLMHGMSGTHTAVAHTAATPAATAVSRIVDATAGHEAYDRIVGAPAETGSASVLHDDASSPLGAAPTVLAGAGSEPWLGLTMLCLFIVVSLALVLRVVASRRDLSAPLRGPVTSATRGASTFVRAIPLRLALSIDRR